jgi:acyl-CoA dehydrogenase
MNQLHASDWQARYDLPFFAPEHLAFAHSIQTWASAQHIAADDDRLACKKWVKALGAAGYLQHCVVSPEHPNLDSRSLVVARESLAYHEPLADFAFAMQGLGSGPISLAGSPAQQAHYLPKVATGEFIAAFALSEAQAGSDVAAMQTTAEATADGFVLRGEKTWISNGGIADFYCLFAKTKAGVSAFIVDAQTPGFDARTSRQMMAPHPIATLKLQEVHLPKTALLGELGGGFKLAMRTLDIFRASVAAAALGMARRALFEAQRYAQNRPMYGARLADLPLTQAKFGDMWSKLDAAALLTYRAAWLRDHSSGRVTVPAAMAKMVATESAQWIIDQAVQIHGGAGVEVGSVVEHLYRDIRALRIYEGATEVQQLIIGKAALA